MLDKRLRKSRRVTSFFHEPPQIIRKILNKLRKHLHLPHCAANKFAIWLKNLALANIKWIVFLVLEQLKSVITYFLVRAFHPASFRCHSSVR